MKKLFISVPVIGRKEEDIFKSMDKMHRIAEAMANEPLERINSWVTEDPPADCKNPGIWYLGKSIESLSKADYFIGIEECWRWKGCKVELDVAYKYGLERFAVQVNVVAPDAIKCLLEGQGYTCTIPKE